VGQQRLQKDTRIRDYKDAMTRIGAKTTKPPSEPPPGSELIGHTPEGKEVYKDKNGKQWVK
jgi:hypothetical protein